jgi:hypothetical protein
MPFSPSSLERRFDYGRAHRRGAVHPIRWKKQFAGLGVQELRELRSLRDENRKLKQVVADLTLDRHILQEMVRKKL